MIALSTCIVPADLACLEWAGARYFSHLRCASVAELKYTGGTPWEKPLPSLPLRSGPKVTKAIRQSELHVDAERVGTFRPGAYGLVISTNVHEHLSHPEQAFRSMVAAMAPSGWLVMTVPFVERLHGEPWDFHRYTYWALAVYAFDHKMCIRNLGDLAGPTYHLSYMLAQSAPCKQPAEVLKQYPRLTTLRGQNGYTLR